MVPTWLHVLAIISLALAGVCALIVAADEMRHPQKMWIMNVVWPINALYFGPIGLWAYFAIGRKSTKEHMEQMQQEHSSDKPKEEPKEEPKDPIKKAEQKGMKPFWQIVAVGVTHCGAGCTLGDIIAEWVIFWTGWMIAGIALWPEYILDFTLAYLLGIVFQFFAIAPMRNLGVKEGLIAAVKADTLSLTAFEVGLFGWMALTSFVFFPHPHIRPTEPAYWLMMQIGMILGFFTSYPVNVWLIKRGLKEAM
jgi:hypothetical protein